MKQYCTTRKGTGMLKKLSNLGEQRVYDQLKPAAERYGAEIYRKVRIADAVDIDALEHGLGGYALKAHFDFVVTDPEHMPQFAVEFDGSGHSTAHDAKKDKLCQILGLALFRVDLRSSDDRSGEMDFLAYLVHLWFLAMAFQEMQAKGELPPDEPFFVSGFVRPDAKTIFDSEFDLLGPARGKVTRFCAQKKLSEGAMSHFRMAELLMVSQDGQYGAFCSLPVGDIKLYGQKMLTFKAPSYGALGGVLFARHEIGQFCTAGAYAHLLEELKLFDQGAKHVLARKDEVFEQIESMKRRGFKMMLQMNEL